MTGCSLRRTARRKKEEVVELIHPAGSASAAASTAPASAVAGSAPAPEPKRFYWRTDGKALIDYLLDSEVHTYAFSVAANAILSFIPFCVLLYTLALNVFHSQAIIGIIDDMVNYYLPTHTVQHDWVVRNILLAAVKSSAGGIQAISIAMILISCTGIFLPLEVALNRAWGGARSRNYLMNQAVALGLALLMVALGMASIFLNLEMQKILSAVFLGHTGNFVFRGLSYAWLSLSTGAASILFFFSIYWILPNRKVPWRPVLRTAMGTGVVWLGARAIFVAVLPHLELGDLYGPFHVSVGLLFWAYISGLILFAGAQFSVSRLEVGRGQVERPAAWAGTRTTR